MSRILLVGDTQDAGFAPLRTRHFAAVLGGAAVLDWREGVAKRAADLRPEVVVTAGNHGPTRAALAALQAMSAAGLPSPAFWLDVAGDPFAEAQARAAWDADPATIAAESVTVWAAALARADAFSTVCAPGRHALIGALGALGRLPLLAPGREPIHVLPCATDFPDEPGPARAPGLDVALLGGFNTWLDDETLLGGLLLAMDRAPVRVKVLGGPIPGHYSGGWERFVAGVRASPHAARFQLTPWPPHAALAEELASCHVTVCLDRPGPEAELGARTRVLYALHQGLRVLATPGSPIVRELVEAGLVEATPAGHSLPPGEAAHALAAALLNGGGAPPEDRRRAWLRERSATRLGEPLALWAANPVRTPHAAAAGALATALRERDRALAELAEVRRSPTYRALNRIHRLVPKR